MKSLQDAFAPFRLGRSGLVLKNAFIKTATYEGMYDEGIPTRQLIDHHVALAKGDVALTTVAYGAVSPEGRTFDTQMYIHDRSLAVLAELANAVHAAGGKVSMQLTHCGYFSKNKAAGQPLAPSRVLNKYGALSGMWWSRAMTRADMDKVADDFASAASRLKAVGFDAVEIHMGHGYLLSQFLSPKTNRRTDEYGGNVENRARFPLEVLRRVVEAVGPDFPVLVKLNLDDGSPGGFTLADCRAVAQMLEDNGCTAIVLSGGFTSMTPFYLMRGDVPLGGMIRNGTSLAEKLTMMLFGPFIIKRYTFSPNFFLEQAKVIRASVGLPLVYLGGVDSRDGIEEIRNAGFEGIAIGRALIHDPDFLVKLRTGVIEKSGCTRCNQCVVEMDRGGVRCVL